MIQYHLVKTWHPVARWTYGIIGETHDESGNLL